MAKRPASIIHPFKVHDGELTPSVEAGRHKEITLDEAIAELERGSRALLMVRHGERPHIDHEDPTFGEALPLTDAGYAMSVTFGKRLKAFAGDVQFMSSPLRRTLMTATGIAEGMGMPDAPIPTDDLLGNSSFYFSDQQAVFELFRDGRFFDEIFAYFKAGRQIGFHPLDAATDRLEEWCLSHFTARLGIFTTHDLYNGAFLHARGVKTDFDESNWIRFLDSAAIFIRPDGTRSYALVRAGLSDRVTGVDA